jgi:hypothetical protein
MPRRYPPESRPVSARGVLHREPAGEERSGRVVEPDLDQALTRVVGARVHHAQFGAGVVVGQEGHGPEARLTVRFAGGLTKRVVARFLSLVAP